MTLFTPLLEKILYGQFPSFLHPLLKSVFNDRRYLTKKTFNLIVNQLEKNLKRSYLFSYPYSLVIDPTNICNLQCPLCPTWKDVKARPKGKMDIQTFSSLLDEAGPYLFALNLCNWGEPFLNPMLPQMVAYAKKFNIVVGLSTNLNHLPDALAKRIIDSGIDIIVISLDGATQESYSKYRRGGDIATVFRNINTLNSHRGDNKTFPLLIWQFLVNKYNESELAIARDMAHKMGLLFLPSPMRSPMGKELLMPLYQRVKEMEDWLPQASSYNKYAYEILPETRTRQTTCKWLWNSTVVNWDGSLSPCCGVFEKTWDFQTCYDNGSPPLTLHQAWNSPRYRLARRLVAACLKKSRNLEAIATQAEREGLICRKCITYGFLED